MHQDISFLHYIFAFCCCQIRRQARAPIFNINNRLLLLPLVLAEAKVSNWRALCITSPAANSHLNRMRPKTFTSRTCVRNKQCMHKAVVVLLRKTRNPEHGCTVASFRIWAFLTRPIRLPNCNRASSFDTSLFLQSSVFTNASRFEEPSTWSNHMQLHHQMPNKPEWSSACKPRHTSKFTCNHDRRSLIRLSLAHRSNNLLNYDVLSGHGFWPALLYALGKNSLPLIHWHHHWFSNFPAFNLSRSSLNTAISLLSTSLI